MPLFCFLYILPFLPTRSPSMDDFERKKRVIDYVIHSRRQIIKLLVLVKWSANAAPAHKIMVCVLHFFASGLFAPQRHVWCSLLSESINGGSDIDRFFHMAFASVLSLLHIQSVVGFLQRQNQQFERTVNILKASKANFYTARYVLCLHRPKIFPSFFPVL